MQLNEQDAYEYRFMRANFGWEPSQLQICSTETNNVTGNTVPCVRQRNQDVAVSGVQNRRLAGSPLPCALLT